jgi:SOS-response transcriptional repressor LexA
LRESLEITQGDLADAAGMDQSLLSKYEREDVSPSWLQIERLLEAMGQSPCSLFQEECATRMDDPDQFFAVKYFSGTPKGPEGMASQTTDLQVHRDSLFVKALNMPPESGRYIAKRADQDAMIPDWYPGELLITDTKYEAKAGRVIAGFYDGEPMARRLVREGKMLLIVASNRNYPPIPFDPKRWNHQGVVVYAVRELSTRYMGEMSNGATH